ncbi:DUF1254 domain-containing protein [Pelagibacterium lacus]|uniref:DUF1254 domain-containing protein n=1 Tax=Pelagibacterium lacus TaxID=2282655 RepID=A0A369WAR8_9HYPH|nr:hypothetical protein [Pelagibacterium lacus]RDE10490.1 hypothetical protein DVH29_00625 [Pelagibacterium lacus]
MMRWLFWIGGGLVLGGLIHLVVILTLPAQASRDIWHRLEVLGPVEAMAVLPDIAPGQANPLGLDPELLYGVCRLELGDGPGIVNGELPLSFWSVSVFNPAGHVIYATTNRSGSGDFLDMGLFNPAQTRLLAEQRFEIAEGLLIVEAGGNDAAVVVRLAPPHPAMRDRYRTMLENLTCQTIR